MSTATAAPKKLTPKQARELADAEGKVAELAAKLDDAKAARDVIRDKLRERIAPRQSLTVGGVTVKVTPYSYDQFSLKSYVENGQKVTAAMRPFISTTDGEKWTVKRSDG